MTERLPPLNPMRAFEATARHGSVSGAAGELSVTHGAVSHQIRALEAALEVKLFERGARRLRLTEQGALLVISPTLLNRRPLRTPRDLEDHVILHNSDRREWRAWLRAADALALDTRGTHHFLSDARLGMDAAVHGQGVALGDSMTASELLANGLLVSPLGRSVSAVDGFYVACRNEALTVPLIRAFIDWLYAERTASSRALASEKGSRHGKQRR